MGKEQSMSASISTQIKNRKKANDVFITPLALAKVHIEMVDVIQGELWLDPCKNDGSYFNQFPSGISTEYCELLEGKDFMNYQSIKPIGVIIQNPPYSIMDKWIQKNISLKPRLMSFLIGLGNLTARRIEMFEKAGYGLTKMKMLKVFKWYGMSVIVNFELGKKSIIEIDRTVYKN